MTKNPFINSLLGLLYIVVLVSVFFYTSALASKEPSVFYPIAALSLFVFSASMMGYLFLYQPLQLFLEGAKKEAVDLFLKTVGIFGVCATALVLVGLYAQGIL